MFPGLESGVVLFSVGADLQKHGNLGKVIAGFHSDLNFLTIHGKSRYPGLYVWLRDGTRVPVRIPGSLTDPVAAAADERGTLSSGC